MNVIIKVEGKRGSVLLCTIKEGGTYEFIKNKYCDTGIQEKMIELHNVLNYDFRIPDRVRPFSTCYDPLTENMEITYYTVSRW